MSEDMDRYIIYLSREKFCDKISLVTLKNGSRNPHYYSKLWLHSNCLDLILTLGRPHLKFCTPEFSNFCKISGIWLKFSKFLNRKLKFWANSGINSLINIKITILDSDPRAHQVRESDLVSIRVSKNSL